MESGKFVSGNSIWSWGISLEEVDVAERWQGEMEGEWMADDGEEERLCL